MRAATVSESAQTAARSQLGEWGLFLGALLLVLSPVLCCGAALEALAWRIGETMPLTWTSAWQDVAPNRIWRGGDGHSFLAYKLARIADLKPEIVAVGPSRANFFRSDATAPYSFFNAGMSAWTFDQYRRFLELLTQNGPPPRALIFNLDYWMFAEGFDHYFVNRFDEQASTHIADLLRVVAQLRDDPMRLIRGMPATGHVHGLYAVLTGEGFRPDGSMLLHAEPTSDPQRLFADGTAVGTPPVELRDHMADEQIKKFDAFVALAKDKHVALIGIQLPYYAKILDGLNASPAAGMWREFESPEWRARVAAAGVVFFDLADMPEYRDKPQYFVDSLDPDTHLVEHVMQLVAADPRVRALLPKITAPLVPSAEAK